MAAVLGDKDVVSSKGSREGINRCRHGTGDSRRGPNDKPRCCLLVCGLLSVACCLCLRSTGDRGQGDRLEAASLFVSLWSVASVMLPVTVGEVRSGVWGAIEIRDRCAVQYRHSYS